MTPLRSPALIEISWCPFTPSQPSKHWMTSSTLGSACLSVLDRHDLGILSFLKLPTQRECVISSLAPSPPDIHQGPSSLVAQEALVGSPPTLLKRAIVLQLYVADLAARPFKKRKKKNMTTSLLSARMRGN